MSLTNEFQRMVMEEPDESSGTVKKCDRKLKLLVLILAVTLLIMMVMSFAVFYYQQRRLADQEIWYQNCSLHSGVQTKRLSDIESLISNFSSSCSSVLTKLETKLQDLDSQKNTLSEIKTSVSQLTSSVNSLSSKLQNTDGRVMKLLLDLSDLKTKLENSTKTIPHCKSGWIRFQSKCYFFSEDLVTWDEARNSCRSENSMLVKVETDEELTFLTVNLIDYWIGLTDETTGEWRWDDGSPFVRNSHWWGEGQPDNWDGHGLGGGEDCGHLRDSGELNDLHCSEKMKYICQM
ncbi:C-type lectin domain family 10 member A-like isoform 2-T2 [Clarias gariepinus]|uniref:C-type lectin domain family 10 member A-like isoform X2 n=1 Tax=Clarias gariepinus TaxID=13013 RepID=UPI00234C3D52|nr:C-type lectin domain family 10 member A-like isoform X2 [Clarias gariepinus]